MDNIVESAFNVFRRIAECMENYELWRYRELDWLSFEAHEEIRRKIVERVTVLTKKKPHYVNGTCQ